MLIRLFQTVGQYLLFMGKVLRKPDKWWIFYREMVKEIEKIGLNSIWIVAIISTFMGAVITMQTAYNTENPFLPNYLIGVAARDSILLEFSSTIVALILAGKVGSSIASEIGTMRVSEQIDALEVMGVNSANYLVLPKVVAAVVFNPFLCIMSIFVGIAGGWVAGCLTGVISTQQYLEGILYAFEPYYVLYAVIKTIVFAIIITTISAFYGYYVRGGSLEVGSSSTKAVVYSSVTILLFNIMLTQLLLA